jgi:3-oxoacyl-[acyl-carrier-protein] synthase II
MESTWDSLQKGCSGIDWLRGVDTEGLACGVGGELKDFDSSLFMSKKDIQRYDPFIHYGVASALMALNDARIKLSDVKGQDLGVMVGSGRGGIITIEKAISDSVKNSRHFSAYLMPATTIAMAASYIAMQLKITGPCMGISNACASGLNAIGHAFDMIRAGKAAVMLAGGSEAPLCRMAIGGYSAARALTQNRHNPLKASRPFDAQRDGFVLSEGASIVVLEELGHALKRNAPVYAEILGYGMSTDAFHPTRAGSHGEALAMQRALIDADIGPGKIDYINAHATSTVLGDQMETEAVKRVFGQRAYTIAVSAIKSMTGHMLGASAALEVAVTALSLRDNVIAPTVNLDFPDPACDLDYVPKQSRQTEVQFAISNSFGFGGMNASIVLKKFSID